jgi:hypothetical protein
VHDFQHGVCLRIHFYNGWQFFLLLLCTLHFRYDRRCQRFSCFADTDANGYASAKLNAHGHTKAYRHTHTYTYTHTNPNTPGPVLAQFHYSGRLRRA